MDLVQKLHICERLGDTAGKMDNGEDANAGLVARRKLLSTTKSVDLIGHFHCDVFSQEKLLLNGVEVRLRLVRSRDSFCLMDPIGLIRYISRKPIF